MSPWSEFDLDVGGVALHVVRAGDPDAPTVVLAHGFTDSGACWRSTIDALADRFDVVAPDARHHGGSASPGAAASDEVDDLIGVIEQLGVAPARLVGHSMGARTVAEVATRRPDLVERMVLEDPPWRHENEHRPGRIDASGVRRHLEELATMSSAELEQLVVDQHGNWPEDEHADWVDAKHQVRPGAATLLDSRPWGPIADALACPTLLVHGDPALGGLTSPDTADAIARRNPMVRTAFVRGAGHNIRRERRSEFLAVVEPFLDG